MPVDRARILLLGSNGQVGHELLRTLAPLGEVIATDRAALDLGDESAIRALVRQVRPGVIVNAAAYTAVDRAESEPDLAFTINTRAPGVLAQEAVALGAWLVHYSTDYVFAGDKAQGAYQETDATGPINAYGRSKLAGEAAIAAAGCAHIILRTSWVYGAHGANFVRTIVRLAREREKLSIVADQVGAPTSSHLIAETTAQLIRQIPGGGEAAISGLYHLQSAGEASWYEFAGAIVEQLRGVDAAAVRCREILPIPASAYPTPAQRPANSRLDCGKITQTFGLRLPHWRDDFEPRFREILGL
ncbi:MAG: dTDP-4-dehydrorhamnose reductase [Nevskia sp.]|nr:dTDP-4-dehydrorhamnose reductase [Nevskia sp.]